MMITLSHWKCDGFVRPAISNIMLMKSFNLLDPRPVVVGGCADSPHFLKRITDEHQR